MNKQTGSLLIVLLMIMMDAGARNRDVVGSSDHPMVRRYPGSVIMSYRDKIFSEYILPLGPPVHRNGKSHFLSSLELEGEVTRIAYKIPKGIATYKVYRRFHRNLSQIGFQTRFMCKKEACGSINFWQKFFLDQQVWGMQHSQYIYVGELIRNNSRVYAVLFVGDQGSRLAAEVDIVEIGTMRDDLIQVDPEKLADRLEEQGKVAIYGIRFDTNKAEMKPESESVLEAIAELLQQNPALKLYVVGHTDDQGSLSHNMSLSKARSNSVVRTLVTRYRINRSRLISFGAGPYVPISTNTTEEGRAHNRRVELVKRLR